MRQELEELTAVYDSAPIGLCVLDAELRYIRVNSRLAEINGVPEAEHLGRTLSEVVPSPISLPIQFLARKVLETGEPVYEREIAGPFVSGRAGQRFWDVRMFPIKEESGRVRAVNVTVEEVTGRKDMEKELRESEERFRAVFMSTMDAIVVTDPSGKGKVLSVNPAACRMFGYTEQEFLGLDREALLDTGDPGVRDMLQRREKSGQATATVRYKRKDGTTFLGELSTIFFLDSGGNRRAVGVIRDISRRKQDEDALRESNEQFRAMFDSTNVGMAQGDPYTGKLLHVNETFAHMLGFSVAELTGIPFSEVTHPDDRKSNLEGVSRLVRGEIGIFAAEKRYLRKNGDIIWALVTVSLVRDTSGKPLRTVVVIKDITKRKLAEEAIRANEKKYRDLVETANSIIIRWDRNGRILFMNEFGLEFFGYARAELIGQDIMTIVPRNEEGTGRNLEALIKDIFVHPEEYAHGVNQNMRKGGETCWVAWANRAVMNENNEVVELLAVGNDITGLKKSQDELQKYREHLEELVRERTLDLEEKNRKLAEEIQQRKKTEEEKNRMEAQLLQSQKIEALGSFAGGIAHDLNNILYPIIINTETLLEETDPGDAFHEMLEQTLQAAYRQRDLVKQILSFSRQGVQKLTPVHMTPLLEKTLGFIRSTLPSTIEIRQSVDAPSDIVLGDSIQIQQVIMNLCKNAADSLEMQQGIIEVNLAGVCVEGHPALPEMKPGEYIRLTVKDTGHGMSPETMARIFDPFFTTKTVGKGSGMGLSVVHGILKKHGGHITFESEEGKGSMFTVYLPLIRQDSVSSAAEGKGKGKDKGKILLVDDEEIILSSLERAMQRLGYDVTTEQDPTEAFELFKMNPQRFDLVITDLTMPHMTGLALGKKLMDIRRDIPVILCTGYNDVMDEEQAKKLGFQRLLMKPAPTNDLRSAIQQALGA